MAGMGIAPTELVRSRLGVSRQHHSYGRKRGWVPGGASSAACTVISTRQAIDLGISHALFERNFDAGVIRKVVEGHWRDILRESTRWLVVTNDGRADTAGAGDELVTLIEGHRQRGCPSYTVIDVEAIRGKVRGAMEYHARQLDDALTADDAASTITEAAALLAGAADGDLSGAAELLREWLAKVDEIPPRLLTAEQQRQLVEFRERVIAVLVDAPREPVRLELVQ